ncbi:MAG TPA: adenylate/guanylate cyclase domain-containing protein [Caulobacteraceae bacterium]|jgi:class 3 adenylate cyclase|nr:adenylate/guanylate cyclase domain-containing protein [Caulobacteraceae bacterium]
MIRQALVRFGFRFPEDEKERLFVERFVLVHRQASQIFLLATGLLFCLFFIWDRAVDHVHWKQVFPLREFVLSPVIFAAAAALFFGRPRPPLEPIISITLTVVLVGFETICANLDSGFRYGVEGMLLIYFGGASMFPLRVTYLMGPSAVAVLGFLGLEAWRRNTSADMMIANAMCLGAGVIIGLLSTAGRELAARREFLTDLALAEAHARVDDLLHSMMPHEIVERIQAGESTIADLHGEVSIVFADLVGFTELSRQLSAPTLVDLLNRVFSRFDAAASRFGVEKIKTIGDAYMAVGGLSYGEKARDHTERMAGFALAMRDIAAELAVETELPVAIRIGLHVGPVVAGVIGVKKPAFDCWGAAVNMASRLEHASGPGSVLISESAFDRLRHEFRVEAAPAVDLKGIGLSKVYLLHDRLTAAAAA